MKKRLLVCLVSIAVLFLAVSPGRAQNLEKGFKFGLSLANWSGASIDEDFTSRTGFAAGVYLGLKISEGSSHQPEILYVQKGTKIAEGDAKVVFRADYLEIPILAKYAFALSPGARVFVFAGPAVAFKISGKLFVEVDDFSDSYDLEELKSTDVGLAFGGGIEIPLGALRLSADLRYTLGLTNVYEGDEIKSGAFLILIGIGL